MRSKLQSTLIVIRKRIRKPGSSASTDSFSLSQLRLAQIVWYQNRGITVGARFEDILKHLCSPAILGAVHCMAQHAGILYR